MSDDELTMVAGRARMTMDAATGRIARLRVGAVDVLRTGTGFGSFPMAPWCGRLREGTLMWNGRTHRLPRHGDRHALHGTVRDRRWSVVRHTETEVVVAQQLGEPWPFAGRVVQWCALTDAAATFRMSVEAGAEAFPAQAGWHPWFRRRLSADGQPVALDFAPAWQEERGPDYLPDGNRIDPSPGPWDDCFAMPGGVHVTLTWPGALELTVSSPLRWVVVYDLPADTVCVEPQSGPPDGLNTQPRAVVPGDPLVAEMTWHWRTLG